MYYKTVLYKSYSPTIQTIILLKPPTGFQTSHIERHLMETLKIIKYISYLQIV